MPRIVCFAGINGAGKTTASVDILTRVLRVPTFINADGIARGLNGLNPESVSFAAGRIMLQQMNELVENGEDFAFETTLAARTYAGWLAIDRRAQNFTSGAMLTALREHVRLGLSKHAYPKR